MAYLLQQFLTESAKRDPDHVAVSSEKGHITYKELEKLSNQLAYALRASGVEKGDRIGIYLNKSIESVAAIFGILKAGAVYVPLDPAAPVKRVAYIIANCAMKALVSTGKKLTALRLALSEPSTLRCLVLADSSASNERHPPNAKFVNWSELMQLPAGPPETPYAIEDDLAYILYTSGSTGEPKGVMISHRASLTFVDWASETFVVAATDRLSSHAPLHFDLSIFDIFAAIKAGATAVLVPEELSVFPRDLASWIDQQRISVWYSVPSALTRLVVYGELTRYTFSHLRTILFAGEVFPIKYLRQLMSLIPHAEYYNLYGPTETNVCTYYQARDIAPDAVEALPIGKACNNTEVFAVNEQQQIVAEGEVGELWVRGPSLMKGYWGLPEKSSRTLVPFCLNPALGNEVVYRTGDLVKKAADGNYLFLGRRDNQIKSRGYRIELGEIETALYSHPDLLEVAVIAVPDEEISNTIKAIVVPREGVQLTPADLEFFCSERIPKYMLPGTTEFRSSLPKTSTGKTDKTLLLQQHLETTSTPRKKVTVA